MTIYRGTQDVEPGLYFTVNRFSIKSIDTAGALPGTERDEYRRVPMLAMLALAPLLGLAFVIFLPFIGFAMVLRLAGDKVAQAAGPAVARAVRVVRPNRVAAIASVHVTEPTGATTAGAEAIEPRVEKSLGETERRAS